MYAVALRPGSWPPSPGLEPWAILISSCSARARYSAVTPKRAEATCLIRASGRWPPVGGLGAIPRRVLAALAGVRGAADRLDAQRQRAMRLGRQRAHAHRRHDEPADDRRRRLDHRDRHRRRCRAAGPTRQPSRTTAASRLERVAVRGERAVRRVGLLGSSRSRPRPAPGRRTRWAARRDGARRRRGSGRGRGRGADPGGAAAACARAASSRRSWTEARSVELQPARPRRRGREARRDHRRRQLDRLEQLTADVRGHRADAHAGEDLAQPGVERRERLLDRVRGPRASSAPRPPRARRRAPAGAADGRPVAPAASAIAMRVHVDEVGGVGHDVGPAAQPDLREGGVDAADREHRRDRRAARRPPDVRRGR